MPKSILFIDDDAAVVKTLSAFFVSCGWRATGAHDGISGVSAFEQEPPDVVVLDVVMPGVSGLEVLRLLLSRDPDVAVIMLTGHGDIAMGVEAMRIGAENFLSKPVDLEQLELSAQRFRAARSLRRQARFIMRAGLGETSLSSMGSSPMMQDLARQLSLLAPGMAPVLLTGETGTGKGWAAKLIHAASPRAAQPFVSINCAGLTTTFLDTELFGHERGAFTDAKQAKQGLFEVANGGTMFLDEIGDLALDLQPKLLTVLETNRFRRLGSTRETQVDVRLIAATHKDLFAEMEAGRFREDLYYRLAVLPVRLPALRDRGSHEIAEMATHLLADLRRRMPFGPSSITAEATELLARYSWPGNIREMRNVLERAALIAGDVPKLRPEHLPRELQEGGGIIPEEPLGELSLASVTRRHVMRVLTLRGGNRRQTASALGVTRSTLYKWLRDWGVEDAGR